MILEASRRRKGIMLYRNLDCRGSDEEICYLDHLTDGFLWLLEAIRTNESILHKCLVLVGVDLSKTQLPPLGIPSRSIEI